ncbi:MAG: hypothetical protein JKX94_12425 [Sneathiella sp.]|nr:hypothetical protein [Sneathiella sp.]
MKLIKSLTTFYLMRDMVRYLPVWVQLWMGVMMAVLFVAPLFFLDHAAAQWMSASFMLGGLIMGFLHMKIGITKLMGIAHLPWLYPLFLIFQDLSLPMISQNYTIWLVAAAGVSVLCLVIDAIDVIRYLTGNNRQQLAPPAPT